MLLSGKYYRIDYYPDDSYVGALHNITGIKVSLANKGLTCDNWVFGTSTVGYF
jgi:hypothetical protein